MKPEIENSVMTKQEIENSVMTSLWTYRVSSEEGIHFAFNLSKGGISLLKDHPEIINSCFTTSNHHQRYLCRFIWITYLMFIYPSSYSPQDFSLYLLSLVLFDHILGSICMLIHPIIQSGRKLWTRSTFIFHLTYLSHICIFIFQTSNNPGENFIPGKYSMKIQGNRRLFVWSV